MRRAFLVGLAALAAIAAALIAARRRRPEPVERTEPVERVVSERPLETMTRDELYELARELDIPGRSRMKKTDLRAAVSRAGRSG
jgi:hypothetical protein